jgi:hypothetical protein
MNTSKSEIEPIVEYLTQQLIDELLCEIDVEDEEAIEYAFMYLEKIVQELDHTDYTG